jgi:hypothetical protein
MSDIQRELQMVVNSIMENHLHDGFEMRKKW